jgi:hypothetical protein
MPPVERRNAMQTQVTLFRKLRAALAITATGAALAAPVLAHGYDETWSSGRILDVQMRVEGQAAPLYDSPRGDQRKYFEAIAGGHYSLVVRNTTSSRVGVLITVDGLNVVNGERSALSPNETMYVLGPWETTTIRGWRTSLEDIRRFVFVDERRSYAERTGQANSDMGWIRVLAFREQRNWWDRRQVEPWFNRPGFDERSRNEGRRDQAPPTEQGAEPQASAPAPASPPAARGQAKTLQGTDQLGDAREGGSYPGTGWGEHGRDVVGRTQFTAERRATDTHVFRYEYASGLHALGIFPDRDRLDERDGGAIGFAKPPRW